MADAALPGLYIHVPFCRTRCPYCDFYSSTDLLYAPDFTVALETELFHYKKLFPAVDTLYLGGGTPTVLADTRLQAILDMVRRHIDVDQNAEITIEANPNDLNPGRLHFLRATGFNRLSIGVQSFSDRTLRCLGRRHTAQEARDCIAQARQAGFDNLSLDFMYGIPGQSAEEWLADLGQALSFFPEHLSCYQLTIKEHTPFFDRVRQGGMQPCPEQEQTELFLATSDYLETRGYSHYEVSNFCRAENLQARHNAKYWEHAAYLGLGPSAHSFDGCRRWWNINSVGEYLQRLLQKTEPGQVCMTDRSKLDSGFRRNDGNTRLPLGGYEELTEEQLRIEKIMLGLRTRRGCARELLSPAAGPVIETLQSAGLISTAPQRILPTTRGMLLADSLALQLSVSAL